MNIRDLTYLVALADLGHFGKAADACFVSQPGLSMQIKKLEESLGVKLLERTNKSVMLTDTGILIAERARQILVQVDELREVAASAKDPYCGELRVGVFPTLAPYLLPVIMPALSTIYPDLSFYLLEEKTADLIEQLKGGKLHAAFLSLPINETSLNHEALFEEEFMLAVPVTHQLSKRKMIKSQELMDADLLLLDEGHCLREQALSFCLKNKAAETKAFRATSLETLRHMVAAGVGITLMPKLACNADKHVAYIPFNAPKPLRSIGLYWRGASSKQKVLTEIAADIRKIMNKQKVVKVIS